MSRLISPKIQQKVFRSTVLSEERKPVPVNIRNDTGAPYPISVCICVPDTVVNIQTIQTLQSYFQKSFVVFIGEESIQMDHSFCLTVKNASEAIRRNAYLSFVVSNKAMFEYMLVVDPSAPIIRMEHLACLKKDTWDAVFANQSYKYYDIESLRSAECPTDMLELDEEARQKKRRQLQRHIPRHEDPIPVASAFGGLAIYKTKYLKEGMYATDGHVSFNARYSRNGGSRMFLEPSMILETRPEDASRFLM